MRLSAARAGVGVVAAPAYPGYWDGGWLPLFDPPPLECEARRQRALAIARERYTWEAAVVGYLALTDRLVDGGRP
jgi:hypothetical protein